MPIRRLISWFRLMFGGRTVVKLGLFGPPNAGKTSLANRISMDWTGSSLGSVSEIPHETRKVQKKEQVVIRHGDKRIVLNLLDMPGVSSKNELYKDHFKTFIKKGLSRKQAYERLKQATRGVAEAVGWLGHVDSALIVLDATKNPYTQVNAILVGTIEAKKIPLIIVANKMDLRGVKPERIKEAFSNHPVIEISCLMDEHLDPLYEALAKHHA